MNLAELLQPWVSTSIPVCEIVGLHNDSRQIKAGYLFFAYPGVLADGRLFIQQAIAAGAAAIIYDANALPASWVLPTTIPCLPVAELASKLAAIASHFYNNPARSLNVIGVTGTSGKTTIAYQLAQAYDLLGEEAAYIGTLGQGRVQALQALANTTPDGLCLQQLFHDYKQAGLQRVCMEVSSHALSQKRAENIEFVQAIYTNLSHDHLDYHLTMSAYAAAKAQLFAIPTLKSAIVNHDDEYAPQMVAHLPAGCEKLTYGIREGSDVCAIQWQSTMAGSEFEVSSPWGKQQVRINILGAFNVYNSLAIFTSLLANGFEAREVVPVMAKLQAAPGRMEVVVQEPCVIVDFAHTPDALENVLSTLLRLKRARLIVVFGCGGDRDKAKRPVMGHIAGKYADVVVVTSDNPRTENPAQIIADIATGLPVNTQALTIVNREQAIAKALSLADKHDIVLIAGKGHESYQEIGRNRFDFSDQDVVRRLVRG